jgi:hypothetical protein
VRDDVLSVLPAAEREVFVTALRRLGDERLTEPVRCTQPVRRRAAR